MHRPAVVTAPASLPILVAEVKSALRIDDNETDAEIERLIRAAVAHFEGWDGLLGIALVGQTLRQDYDAFADKMMIPVGPVQSIEAVRYRNSAGQLLTIADTQYALKQDAGGRYYVRFVNEFTAPSDLYEDAAVSIEYLAGWPIVEGAPTTPADIKTAIVVFVQKHFDEAARSSADILQRVESDLVYRYRKPI